MNTAAVSPPQLTTRAVVLAIVLRRALNRPAPSPRVSPEMVTRLTRELRDLER